MDRESQPDVVNRPVAVYPLLGWSHRLCSSARRHGSLEEDQWRPITSTGLVDDALATVPEGALVGSIRETRQLSIVRHGSDARKGHCEDRLVAGWAEFACDVARVCGEARGAAIRYAGDACTPAF